MLARIEAPHFVAGIVLKNDVVVIAADILKYMGGWTREQVRNYCNTKGWRVTVVKEGSVAPIVR